MRILCPDDEELALQMIVTCVKKVKPDADVEGFDDQDELLEDLRFPIVPKKNAKLRIQCFGNFDVFKPNGEHVRFERSKAKEVFAFL